MKLKAPDYVELNKLDEQSENCAAVEVMTKEKRLPNFFAIGGNTAILFGANRGDYTTEEWYEDECENITEEEAAKYVKKYYDPAKGDGEYYISRHLNQDTSRQREDFLSYLPSKPEKTEILDAGCGTGCVIKKFIEAGYRVSAFDLSTDLVELSRERNPGVKIDCKSFKNFKSDKKFDGIWARNSLLHVPKCALKESLQNMVDHLKDGGILWATMKREIDEKADEARGRDVLNKRKLFFNLVTVKELQNIFSEMPDVEVVKISDSQKNTPDNYKKEKDLSVITFVLRKKDAKNSAPPLNFKGRFVPMVSAPIDEMGKYAQYAAANGLGVEIKTPKTEHYENFEATVEKLAKVLEGFPNKISVHAPFFDINPVSIDPEIRRISRKRFDQALEIAKATRAATVNFHTCHTSYKLPAHDKKTQSDLIEFWKEYIKKFEEAKITAMLENVLETSPEFIQRIVEEVNSPYLQTCLDTGHAIVNSPLSPEEWTEGFKNSLRHMHLHNNDGKNDLHTPFPDGIADFCNMLNEVKKLEQDVNIVFEVNGLEDVKQSAEAFSKLGLIV